MDRMPALRAWPSPLPFVLRLSDRRADSNSHTPMKILFVASEGLPYSKTGGLADVIEGLPKALRDLGHEVAVFLPRYRGNKVTATLISSVTMPLGGRARFPAIAEGKPVDGVRYL